MKHKIQFTKMHGLGNDFIVIDGINQRISDIDFKKAAPVLCDRNFGIGGDGIVIASPSDHSDVKMFIINADGSVPETCGNGIRCLARFAFEEELVEKEVLSIETLSGVTVPAILTNNGTIQGVEVDMGAPIWTKDNFKKPLSVSGKALEGIKVSMGNPHVVIFVDEIETAPVDEVGAACQKLSEFKDGVNVEFVEVVSRDALKVRVWERGVGETLACGTGACAAVVASILDDKVDEKVNVQLPGGQLKIEWQQQDGHVVMTGPAVTVYKGEVHI